MVKTKEHKNVLAFAIIKRKYLQLMQLAVGKEKRAVLLDFYNIDWNGL
jgi:hypothetical protein